MIVDASVAFNWIVVEEGSDAAASLFGQDEFFAPTLMLAEVGNAFWKKAQRNELRGSDAYPDQLALLSLLLTILDDADIMPSALALAVRYDHSIYDCAYLALAERRRDVLITADRRADKIADTDLAALVRTLA